MARVVGAGLTLDSALAEGLPRLRRRDDRSFAKELCFGALRWFERLEFILEQCLEKPMRSRDNDLRMLILVGLYQLHRLDTPPHAAVAATVEAAEELGKPWAKALVNGILRQSQREAQQLAAAAERHAAARYAHPPWLIECIKADWPDCWEDILHANNQRPPQHLRVNARRTGRQDYLEALARAGITAQEIPLADNAVQVLEPVDVVRLPGFADGRVSVQDAGAQLAAPLLDLRPGQRVLDACAAPGGKTTHLLENRPQPAEVVAVDLDENRLERLRANLRRLGLDAVVIAADAAAADSWWDGRPFDRILLDAPCSATGVIRRHPDIKRLKTPAQVAALQAAQSRLLAGLWPLLSRNGKLVYGTCSLLRAENDQAVQAFLDERPEATPEPVTAAWGTPTLHGRQLLSCRDAADGFYYAVLKQNDTMRPTR